MKKNKTILILIITMLMILFSCSGIVVAKYIKEIKSDYKQIHAGDFFFESDLLGVSTKEYNQNTTDITNVQISFKLHNFKDELNQTAANIDYTIKYYLMSNVNNVKTLNGTIEVVEKTDTIIINLNELNPQNMTDTIFIEASSTQPFVKTLTAKFNIQTILSATTMIVEDNAGSNIATVSITTGENFGSLVLNAPSGYYIDPTSYADQDVTVDFFNRTISLIVTEYSNYTFTFLKEDPSQMITSGFDCTLNGIEVSISYE